MNTNGTTIEIDVPCGISTCDMNLLKRCEGRIFFLRSVRSTVPLSDVDYSSYVTAGVEPDTLTLMAAYKVRFPAIITRVFPRRICAVVLSTGQVPAGLTITNTGPFELCNGDSICFIPSIFECLCNRIRLESIDSDLIFPATVPSPIYGEVIGKIMARAVEALASGRVRGPEGRQDNPYTSSCDVNVITYNGKRYTLLPCIQRLDAIEPCIRTLILNMMFSVTEGTMLLLSMIPHLLALSADDGYVNTLIGLESATRTAGQLIQIPRPQPHEDATRRFPLFEAIAAWIQMAQNLGETLSAKPFLKVCTFDGPSVIKPGEQGPVIANWF